MMVMFCQPCDYRFRGRNLWINPDDVVSITTTDYTSYGECIITLRDGRSFTVSGKPEEISAKLNSAPKA